MDPRQTIGSIVAEDYRTADVFSRLGIDFCCKGGRTIEEVCAQKGLEADLLIDALKDVVHQHRQPGDLDIREWSATQLADYIEQKHHHYVRESTPVLIAYLKKIVSVHGDRHPELYEVLASFTESSVELLKHMIKEETVLFPAIRRMDEAVQNGVALDPPLFFGTVGNPISMMRDEHEVEGERFAYLAAISHNYTPPEDACNTYKVAFAKLKEFETDLHRHIHLENNILFHKAVELEAALKVEVPSSCQLAR